MNREEILGYLKKLVDSPSKELSPVDPESYNKHYRLCAKICQNSTSYNYYSRTIYQKLDDFINCNINEMLIRAANHGYCGFIILSLDEDINTYHLLEKLFNKKCRKDKIFYQAHNNNSIQFVQYREFFCVVLPYDLIKEYKLNPNRYLFDPTKE